MLISSWQQSSTADMLDEAVQYIKDLRKQLKVLKYLQKYHFILKYKSLFD
jgi:hypothetical protein